MNRWLVVIALAATAAVGLSVASPAAAVQAAGISPVAPPPINVLPSVVKAAASGAVTGTANAQLVAVMLYKFAKSPAFWKAAAAAQAAAATAAQTAAVTAVTSTHAIPATKFATLAKGAGTAGLVLGSFQIGTMAGAAGLDFAGVDTEGLVCGTGAEGWQTAVGGLDCSAFYQQQADYIANADAAPGVTGGLSCDAYGRCVQLLRAGAVIDGSSYYCWKVTGATSFSVYGTFVSGATIALGSNPSSSISFATVCPPEPRFTPDRMFTDAAPPSAGALVSYYIAGTAASTAKPVTTTSADPERRLKCVVVGTNGVSYTAFSSPFFESSGSIPDVVCADLPPEVYPTKTTIWETGNGADVKLHEQTTTPEFNQNVALYPECMNGTCMLDLQENGISCFSASDVCTGWYESPDKTSTMTCRFGAHAVALSECSVYAPSWAPDARGTGDTLGDPATGEPMSNPNPGGTPGTGTGSVNDPVQDPNNRECLPSGWGLFNPVEWVLKPGQCALEWAFVPRTEVLNETLTQVTTALDTKMPGQLITIIGGIELPAAPTGCNGITVSVFFLGPPFQIMQACPGDMLRPLADLSRFFGNIAFTVYGIVAVTRHVARIFAFGGLGES